MDARRDFTVDFKHAGSPGHPGGFPTRMRVNADCEVIAGGAEPKVLVKDSKGKGRDRVLTWQEAVARGFAAPVPPGVS